MASAAQSRISTIYSPKLSPAEMKKAQKEVVEDTLSLVREKFATMTREEQAALTARIVARKVR
jgi:hypothetical protein